MLNKLLSGEEVARILNISKAFAYHLMANGQIQTIRMGRSVRVRPEDLERFIQESGRQSEDLSLANGLVAAHLHKSKI